MRRYVISTKARSWGAVVAVHANMQPVEIAAGSRCYASFAGRTTPCDGCPVRSTSFDKGEAVSVLAAPPDEMWVASARRLPRDTAEVTICALDDKSVGAVIREKLQRVARAAQLSARERTVLDLLLLGRRNDEIAAELEISVRTAKFHQANILKKLDVDSRLDLLRLLL